MYVILGAAGFLGSYLIQSVLTHTEERILAAARKPDGITASSRVTPVRCDVTVPADREALAARMREGEPCRVIYLAAYHNIDMVAKHPRDAWQVNIIALAEFLNAAENVQALFFASTDCVYGEGSADYGFKESDPLNPVSVYGVQKAAAEGLVTAYGYHVLRLPYLFGPSIAPGKQHFYDLLTADFKNGKSAGLYYDSLRSTLDYQTAADTIVRLAECNRTDTVPRILNVCGDAFLSKYDLGLMLAEKLGTPPHLAVPVTAYNPDTDPGARRAFAGLMDNALLKQTLGIEELTMTI